MILSAALLAAAVIVSVSGCQLPIGTGKPVTGVTLNRESLTLGIGAHEQLVATVLPAKATNKAVSWASSNANVAVNSSGLVTAQTAGSAVVTVTTMDGSFTDTCPVTVTATVPVSSVALDRDSATMPYGATLALTATVLPSNATNKDVTWSSSGSNATVSSTGLVTASGLGSATITVTTDDGGITDTCAITVIPSVALNKSSTSLTAGHSETLVATVAPTGAPNKAVTWTTSDPDIAAVDGGFVLAISAGTATITATAVDGSNAATCAVTVTGSLAHDYNDVLPAADAIQEGLNAAVLTDDNTQTAYCEFVTTPSWSVTIHLAAYHPTGSVYTASGVITAPVNPDYTVGAMTGTVTLAGGTVTSITYHAAVFKSPKSGSVDIVFGDGVSGTMDLATGVMTQN